MAAPTTVYLFDTNKTRTVPTTAGHRTDGYAANEVPASNEQNYLFGAFSDWIAYLTGVFTRTQRKVPNPSQATNWALSAYDGTAGSTSLKSSGAGAAVVPLASPEGHTLRGWTLGVYGNAAANLTISVERLNTAGTGTKLGGALTLTAPAAAFNDYTLRYGVTSTGLTVTVTAGGSTWTRSAGSYITDGFMVGQNVTWSGFTNSGNNVTGIVTALTATVMTLSAGATVNETGPAGGETVVNVAPTVDAVPVSATTGGPLQMRLTASATGLIAYDLRYTYSPT